MCERGRWRSACIQAQVVIFSSDSTFGPALVVVQVVNHFYFGSSSVFKMTDWKCCFLLQVFCGKLNVECIKMVLIDSHHNVYSVVVLGVLSYVFF